jgi:hypothetical protein
LDLTAVWIIVAGGKYDFDEMVESAVVSKVVDHFEPPLLVQCGEEGHWHPPLDNVLNLVGRTTARRYSVDLSR